MRRAVLTLKSSNSTIQSQSLKKSEWIIEERGGLKLIFSPLLKTMPELTHAFTTRLGGSSPEPLDSFNLGRHFPSPESKEDALNNRARLCQVLSVDASGLSVPAQIHSASISWINKPDNRLEKDGVATSTFEIPILLHYADCVPIIVADPKLKVICVIHAGWRGTAGGIATAAVKLLTQVANSKPSDLIAAIGPAIGSCCYPTGDDVVAKLCQTVSDGQELIVHKDGKPHPDLQAFNALQLLEAGVAKIDVCSFCTCCRKDLFYSHRRDNGQTGRQGALACLKPTH